MSEGDATSVPARARDPACLRKHVHDTIRSDIAKKNTGYLIAATRQSIISEGDTTSAPARA